MALADVGLGSPYGTQVHPPSAQLFLHRRPSDERYPQAGRLAHVERNGLLAGVGRGEDGAADHKRSLRGLVGADGTFEVRTASGLRTPRVRP